MLPFSGGCNGVALWCEWVLGEGRTVSQGPLGPGALNVTQQYAVCSQIQYMPVLYPNTIQCKYNTSTLYHKFKGSTLIFASYVTIGPRQGKTTPFVQICLTFKPMFFYEAQRYHSCLPESLILV